MLAESEETESRLKEP